MMKTIARSALGLVVVLAWWTLTGDTISTSPALDTIPTHVWEGGGGTLSIEAEATTPARMMVSFSRDGEGDEYESLDSFEEVAPGTYRWSIDVPKNTGGYVELGADQPKPGDRLRFRILSNGRTVFEDSSELTEPLEPGYAFFVQAYFEDYATGTLSED